MSLSLLAVVAALAVASAASTAAATAAPSRAEFAAVLRQHAAQFGSPAGKRALLRQMEAQRRRQSSDVCCRKTCSTTAGAACGSNSTYCGAFQCAGDYQCDFFDDVCVLSSNPGSSRPAAGIGMDCNGAECTAGSCEYPAMNGTTDFSGTPTCQYVDYIDGGEACFGDFQCRNGNCMGGFCENIVAGGACDPTDDNVCENGYHCSSTSSTCVAQAALGGACSMSDQEPCLPDDFAECNAGSCTRIASLVLGADCTPTTGSQFCASLWCDPSTSKCAAAPGVEALRPETTPCNSNADCAALPGLTECYCNDFNGDKTCASSFTDTFNIAYAQCTNEYQTALNCITPTCSTNKASPPAEQCCISEVDAFFCCAFGSLECLLKDTYLECEGDDDGFTSFFGVECPAPECAGASSATLVAPSAAAGVAIAGVALGA